MRKNDLNKKPSYYLLKVMRLVPIMSQSEKSMLRRMIRSYSDDNNREALYIQLFDCIHDVWKQLDKSSGSGDIATKEGDDTDTVQAKTGTINESLFLERFYKRFRLRDFMDASEINNKARYLYEKILETLRKETSKQTSHGELMSGILDAQLLYSKNLLDDCLEQIEHLKTLAQQAEAAPMMLELLRMERRVRTNSGKMQSIDDLRNIYTQEIKWLNMLDYNTGLQDLYLELLYAEIEDRRVDDDNIVKTKINENLSHLLNQLELPFDSVDYRVNRFSALAHVYKMAENSSFLQDFQKKDYTLIYECFKQVVEDFEKHPTFKDDNPGRYIKNVANLVSYGILAKQNLDSKYMPILDQISETDSDFLNVTVYLKVISFLSQKDFAAAEAYLEKHNVIEQLSIYGHKINLSRKQLISYSAGVAYFLQGKYREAGVYFTINTNSPHTGISNIASLEASTLYNALCLIEDGTAKRHKHRKVLMQPVLRRFENRVQHSDKEGFIHQVLELLPQLLQFSSTGSKMSGLAQKSIDPLKKVFIAERKMVSHLGLFVGWLESKAKKVNIVEVIGEYI